MTDTTQNAAGAAHDAAKSMGDQMKAAGDTLRQSTDRMAQSSAEFGLKLLEQAEANTREAFAAMRAAAQAKDPGEVMRIQSDFIRDQGTRAMNQAREISEIITSFGREAMGQMGRRD